MATLSGIITPTNVLTATSTNTVTNKTFGDPVICSAGSGAAPAITKTGDTNTGIFFPAADTIAFSEGGVEAMRIDSSGNLGIGTSAPTQKLQVNGNIIAGRILSQATGGGEGGEIAFLNPDNASDGLTVDVFSADVGRIFQVRNNSTLQIGQLAGTGGIVTFSTAAAERMRIDSSGNVGIGGTSFGSGAVVMFIANRTTAPTTNPVGGGILYVEAGALKYRGSSGTVTTIANA